MATTTSTETKTCPTCGVVGGNSDCWRCFLAADDAPVLTGSEKQIAYAGNLRDRFNAEMDGLIASTRERGAIAVAKGLAAQDDVDCGIADAERVRSLVLENTDAAWWIGTFKVMTFKQVIRAYAK